MVGFGKYNEKKKTLEKKWVSMSFQKNTSKVWFKRSICFKRKLILTLNKAIGLE